MALLWACHRSMPSEPFAISRTSVADRRNQPLAQTRTLFNSGCLRVLLPIRIVRKRCETGSCLIRQLCSNTFTQYIPPLELDTTNLDVADPGGYEAPRFDHLAKQDDCLREVLRMNELTVEPACGIGIASIMDILRYCLQI